MSIQKIGNPADLVQWQKDLGTVLMDMGLDPDKPQSRKTLQEASMQLCRFYLQDNG